MTRSLRGIALIVMVALVAACSPYPEDGVVDTRTIREKADIQEITGKVFGIKEGASEAALAMQKDRQFLFDLNDQVWAHVTQGAPKPTLTLVYTDVPHDTVSEALDLMIEEAKAEQAKIRQKIADEVADLEAKKQEMVAQRDKAKAGASGYEAAIADAKGAYDAAEASLNKAIKRYNAAIQDPVKNLNAIASKHGLQEIPDWRNPVKSYRYSSFKDGQKPSSCQRARNKFVVNMLDSRNQCLYFSLPDGYDKYDAEVTKVLKDAVLELDDATAKLGERGSWGSKPTGSYAAMAQAKDAYQKAVVKARKEFGDNRDRERIIRNAENWIARFQKQIDEKSSDAELKKQLEWTNFYTSDETSDKVQAYFDAMKEHFLTTYVDTLGDIKKDDDKGDGEFEIGSGYNEVVTVTDALVSIGDRKKVFRHMGVVDLTDPEVQKADAVTVVIEPGSMELRPSDNGVERMKDEVMKKLTTIARKQKREAEKA